MHGIRACRSQYEIRLHEELGHVPHTPSTYLYSTHMRILLYVEGVQLEQTPQGRTGRCGGAEHPLHGIHKSPGGSRADVARIRASTVLLPVMYYFFTTIWRLHLPCRCRLFSFSHHLFILHDANVLLPRRPNSFHLHLPVLLQCPSSVLSPKTFLRYGQG
jgi:hypothetical protein